MSDIIREPYELSIWETSIETKDVINFMPPLSTMYGDEWDKFNEKNTDGEYGGFLDWAKDKSKIANYSKDWTEFSYTNAQDIGDDIYTFETTLELPAGNYVFCIQFKDLVEENLPTEGSATFNINENGFEPLKNYIDSPYKLDFVAGEKLSIQFKVPWSGVQKKLLLLKYTTTSFVSFSTRLGLFSITDGTTAENYEIPDPFPLYDGTDGSWIKKENKLCVIGSNDMTSENRIVNPTIKTNVNGEKTLTFTLYSRYFDADIGEFVNNNFVDLLHSESYLKLRRGFGNNAKWEEYIVKNIAENSENKTYTYTAKRAAAIELGKTGYSLEFSEELMNNQGTAIELTKQVFAGSDWTVEEAESDKFWGAVVEPVYKAVLGDLSNENIKCIRQAKLGSYELYYNEVQDGVGLPETGDDVYIPYSSYENWAESGEIQLLWTEANNIEIDEDGVIYNANSYVLETTNTKLLNNVEISGQIKGDNLQKRIKTRYIKGINRIVEEGTIREKPIYKITDIEYQTDASVPELIVNGSDFQSTAGWRAHGSAAVIDLSTDVDLINIIKEEGYLTSLQLKNESEDEDAYFYNAAIRSNATVIDNFTKGEEYYLVVKGSGTVNAFVSLYEYDNDGNVIFEEDGNSGVILNFKSISTNGNESIFSAVCSDSISKKEIIENNIGLFFKVGADSTLEIESVSLFKKATNENDGYYRPGEAVEAKTITKEIYYDPSLVNNAKATSMEEIVPTSGEDFVPTYYEEYSKISSIKISKSNRFNILQEICEAFECWADLIVEHDERGNITNKKVRLKNFIGENKNVGFSYKINLKGINRTIISDQIVTKLIVEPNNNENGLNGFTTIARAKNNKSKDIALYNFDYYIRQKALDSELVKKDVYDTKGLLYRLGKANSKIADLNGKLIALQMQRTQIQSNLTTQKELYQAARDEIDQLRQDFYDRTNKFFDDITDFSAYDNDPTIKSIVVAIIAQNKVFNAAIDKMVDYELSYEENKKQIAGLESEIDIYKKDQQSYLNIFNDKYANYIQEGTWTDESYYDDDLYYFDAQNVLYTSAFPKVSYTIDVIDVSPLGGQYTPFKFGVGDKTYIEDTEFFGWNISGTSPYKEEVVISEITENLDSPEQNKITVQNYKTQFEDLFQRIAATTQSLQYAAGSYQRAANKITSTNSVDTETIQNSFLNGIINLQNMGNMSVSWTPEGLVISNQRDPNNRLRLSNVGIAQSEDGGDTWKMLVLAGRGIVANSIVTGTLDANKISIKSGDAATFIWNAKGLRAYDTTWGEDGNVLNVNYNNYIEFNDRGLVSHRGENKSFELTAEGNLTLSGSLKVAVLEYGKVQAIGGIVLIRPSSLIKKAEYDEANNQTKIWVETPSQFSIGDWCVIGSNLEDIGKGNNATSYEVLSIDKNDNYLIFSGNLIEVFDDLTNLALVSIIDYTTTTTTEGVTKIQTNNVGIAINSSTNEAFSNARSLSIFESKVLNNTWIRENRLILGQLPQKILDEYSIPSDIEGLDRSYGLYADNAIIKGNLYAKRGSLIGGWYIADKGIYNNKPDFNANLVKNSDETIQNSNLIINEYEFDEPISKDQGPYSLSIKLTLPNDPDLTSIYGELDNDGIAENNLPNRCFTIEQKDLPKGETVVYKIPLTFYTENQNNKIKILREKDPTTYTSPMQIRINWIKVEKGNQFTDYTVYNKKDLEKIHLGDLVGFTWADLYKGKVNESYSSVLWIGGSSGNANFRVTKDGSLYAINATLSGQITATSGIIGKGEDNNTGWRIGEGYITSSWATIKDEETGETYYLDPSKEAFPGVSLSSTEEAIILTPKWTESMKKGHYNVRTYILEKDGFYGCYNRTPTDKTPSIENMKSFQTFSITSEQTSSQEVFIGSIEINEVGEEIIQEETLFGKLASAVIHPQGLLFSRVVSSTGRGSVLSIVPDISLNKHVLGFIDPESSTSFLVDFTSNCFTVSGKKGLSFRLQGSSKINDKIVDVALHIGGGGINHGVWSQTYEKYLIYANGTGEVGFQLPVKFEQNITGNIITTEGNIWTNKGNIWASGKGNVGLSQHCGVRGDIGNPSPKIFMYVTDAGERQDVGIGYHKFNGTEGSFLTVTNDSVWLKVDKAIVSKEISFIESGTNTERRMFEFYKDENNEDTIRIGYGLWEKRGVLPRQSGKTYICASGEIRLYVSNPDYSGTNKTCYVSLTAPDAADHKTFLAYLRPSVDKKITLGTSNFAWFQLYVAEGVIETSDEREKENIFFLNNNIERTSRTFSRTINTDELYSQFFDKLAPAYYNFLGDNKISFGLIAQQIVSVLNELGISEDELNLISHDFWIDEETGEQKDRYGLRYSHFIPLLIHEVQKLKKRVSELENLQSN